MNLFLKNNFKSLSLNYNKIIIIYLLTYLFHLNLNKLITLEEKKQLFLHGGYQSSFSQLIRRHSGFFGIR